MPVLPYLPWLRPELGPRPCIATDAGALTYDELTTWVEAVAEQLAERGVAPGDVVALMLPNRIELVVTMLAAWRLGATATPINPTYTAEEAAYQLDDSAAVLTVLEGPAALADGRPTLDVSDLRAVPRGDLAAHEPTTTELALLIYTSGSTGRPKGVMLSHANLRAMTAMMCETFELDGDDRCLLFLPLFHVNAILVSLLSPLAVGAQLAMLDKFRVESFASTVKRFRPTYFSGVPAIYSLIVANEHPPDCSSVRFAICGAAPAPLELLEAARTKLGIAIIEGYGLTEGTCGSTITPLHRPRQAGSVGVALPGQTVAIMGGDGELLGPNEPGEVVVQGPNVMVGYLNRPEETAETLRGGWLHTGDIGLLTEDGQLSLVDRIKDLIIRGGENIYPKEIESVLHAYPGVLEAAVVGQPDPVMGEVPVAYVSSYPDVDLTPDELIEACRARLARYKIPTAVHVVPAIPKNPVGKIDKPRLRSQLAASGPSSTT